MTRVRTHLRRAVVPALLLCACSSSQTSANPAADTGPSAAIDAEDPEDPGPPAPADWDRKVTPPSDADAAKNRTSCAYAKGSLAGETQGASHPTGKAIPIDTIVIAMQENRSFDHYFQKLKEHGHPDAEVAPPEYANVDVDGITQVKPFRDKQLCFLDTAHSWGAAHTEWNGGKMDGFIRANEESGAPPKGGTADMLKGTRAMGYYGPEELPFMYWAADQYAIGDHYFCSVMTSTWSNRMYLYAASSFGRISNKPPNIGTALTIFDMLQMRRVKWKVYSHTTPPSAMFVGAFIKYRQHHYFGLDQFYIDAKNGTLPEVALVDGSNGEGKAFVDDETDEHPPGVMQVGQAMLAKVTNALMASPHWERSAFFIDYDEHGGLYDHVPPPEACPPDAIPPERSATDAPGDYTRLGIRVPFVLISPWAKKGFIGHHVYDHTSVTRFIEARFDLPAMSARDANAEAPYDMFDFTKVRTDKPAVPEVRIDPETIARCNSTFN